MAYGIEQGRIPTVTLRGGERVPCLGLGTFGSDKYGPEEIAEAVYGAVRYGYRFIDCAAVYQNEDRIGQALGRLFAEGAVERRELFITSKVWNDMHGVGQVMASCKKSLADLGLDYLDLYFVHWPFPNYHAPGCAGDSRNPDSRPFSVEEFMATWRQCEERFKTYNWIHAYPNAAAQVIALWYGSSFDEMLHIIAMEGYDVDCNAAQIATAYAILEGKLLAPRWTDPIGDRLETYMRGIRETSIRELAAYTCRMARKAREIK